MLGYPFLRQRPIGDYIVDFFSKDLKLIIEVDGLTHNWIGHFEKDKKREMDLKTLGFNIIRFNDHEIMGDIENVNRTIQNYIWERENSHPPTPFEGGQHF